ncbi:SH3 domain-containing protein [Aquimarina sp. MMG015]|uniref:tetratricopeptide repeat protein n=1 Tax=Aquimarina TaxID=290174 RepID=UPI0004832F42|nr:MULTISPECIES: SH3 domain-containing protein [Aquimarina]AXT58748.1 ion channel protein [Aquimarina sp. AD1]MBQ4801282.1 SH3 domain-containing protein [Aquimarina sp. MMG015]RKN22967.1 ion channel protein [Aquimarina sp. AD1]
MKNLVVIVVFLMNMIGFAQNDELFEKANTFYNQEEYQQAIDAYTTIINSGNESASLYYNLANANYKLSNIGPSIYFYEKALELAPNDEDIKNNLAYANNATIDAIDVIPEGVISRTINGFTNMFGFDMWAWISILSIVLFVVLFILYYVTRISSKKRLFFIGSWISLVVGLFAIFFAFKQYGFIENNQYAIVFAQETTIKSEPNLRSEEVFELHEGTKVKVTETVNDWKKIKLADGKIGWIPATDLKEL